MDYGRNGLIMDIPIDADVFLVRETPAITDETDAIQTALRKPNGQPPLGELVKKDTKVVIVHTDITRATPNRRLLPVILNELEISGVKKENITLLNGLGTHRQQTQQELRQMLGQEIVENHHCLQHDAYDSDQLVTFGKNHLGQAVQVNRHLLGADLKILTGFIEPHFFAGFSGGPKAILPGVAGAESVFTNHSPTMIAHPRSDFLITDGNPIWEEMKKVASKIPNTFLVNVTLDRANQITGVFAGDLIAAHKAGCDFVQNTSYFPINNPYDIVITSNSGYPLDQNLYQCVKGMAAAKRAVRKGGAILLVAACEEGLPVHGDYARLLKETSSPQVMLDMLSKPDVIGQDTWQVQVQAQVQTHADVFIYSDGLSDEQIHTAMLQPCRDIPATLEWLINQYGERVCVLPQGPLTILGIED